jgi:hypothetical protein
MSLPVRSDDLVIGPLESSCGRVRAPRTYKSRELTGLLLVGLLSIVGAAVAVGLMSAKPLDSDSDGHNSRNTTSVDQQATYAPSRVAEPTIKGAEPTLDGPSTISEVRIGEQDAAIRSEPKEEPFTPLPALEGDAILPSEHSDEPLPVPFQPPDSPVLLRRVDRTGLRNLTISLLASDRPQSEQSRSSTRSATLAKGPHCRQRGRKTPAQKPVL